MWNEVFQIQPRTSLSDFINNVFIMKDNILFAFVIKCNSPLELH
jgi:hypothetical protein